LLLNGPEAETAQGPVAENDGDTAPRVLTRAAAAHIAHRFLIRADLRERIEITFAERAEKKSFGLERRDGHGEIVTYRGRLFSSRPGSSPVGPASQQLSLREGRSLV